MANDFGDDDIVSFDGECLVGFDVGVAAAGPVRRVACPLIAIARRVIANQVALAAPDGLAVAIGLSEIAECT